MSRMTRSLLVLIAFLATVAMNAVANLLPLNGRTTGAISDQFRIHVTPAGYVFSIWSVIYIGLLAYCIYQLTPAGRRSDRVAHIAPAFVVSAVANIAWLGLWHYGHYLWTLAAMLVLLGALISIYRTLGDGRPAANAEQWCVDYPFSLYVGWITVATLVNLSVVLEVLDARPFGMSAVTWAVWMIVAAGIIGLIVGRSRRDRLYQAVVVWAAIGIAVRENQPELVSTAAVACAAVLTIHMLLGYILSRRAARQGSFR
jgi:hypothetical protein